MSAQDALPFVNDPCVRTESAAAVRLYPNTNCAGLAGPQQQISERKSLRQTGRSRHKARGMPD